MASLTCKKCGGAGSWFCAVLKKPCACSCGGEPVPALDRDEVARIFARIKGRKGLRSAAPKGDGWTGRRAYFVWRMARFHGGVDVTMPILAMGSLRHDPVGEDTFDALASRIARHVFGTDTEALARWGDLLLGSTGPTGGEA